MMTNKQNLLRMTGNISQLCGVREVCCTSGKAAGMRIIQVYNAAGLEFSVIPDKCMDLYDFRYRGVNCAFHTKNGLVGNQWYCAPNMEFMNYWSGGMLCTCGLENAGPSCQSSDGAVLPLHGRIGMTPAENVGVRQFWKDDDFHIEMMGQMRESRLEGHNLLLTRKLSTSIYSNAIRLEDTLENQGHLPFDFMLLYHINLGYPIIDEMTEMIKSGNKVSGRTRYEEQRLHKYSKMEAVKDGVQEEVFFHDVPPEKDGMARVLVINRNIGLGMEISYSRQTLPVLAQWKFCAPGEYVMGIEPGNSHIEGREAGQKNNALQSILPGQTLHFSIQIKMIDC